MAGFCQVTERQATSDEQAAIDAPWLTYDGTEASEIARAGHYCQIAYGCGGAAVVVPLAALLSLLRPDLAWSILAAAAAALLWLAATGWRLDRENGRMRYATYCAQRDSRQAGTHQPDTMIELEAEVEGAALISLHEGADFYLLLDRGGQLAAINVRDNADHAGFLRQPLLHRRFRLTFHGLSLVRYEALSDELTPYRRETIPFIEDSPDDAGEALQRVSFDRRTQTELWWLDGTLTTWRADVLRATATTGGPKL